MKVELLKFYPEKKMGFFKSAYGNFNAVIEDFEVIEETFECEVDIDKILVWGEDIFPIQQEEMFAIYQKNEEVFFVGDFKKVDEDVCVINILKSFIFVEVSGINDYLGGIIIKVKENLVKVNNSNIW